MIPPADLADCYLFFSVSKKWTDMRIEYTFRPDLWVLRRAAILRFRRRRIAFRVGGFVVLVFGVILTLAAQHDAVPVLGPVLIALGLILCIEIDVIVLIGARRSQESLRETRTVLDADGVHSDSEVAKSDVRWAAITRVLENDEFWLFADKGRVLKVVPKEVLTPVQRSSLAAFLSSRAAPESGRTVRTAKG
jgi:hypothetical protein